MSTNSRSINLSTQNILHNINDKRSDPITNHKANIWYPKAEEITRLTTNCYNYIENLKREAPLSNELSVSLFRQIESYEKEIFGIDESINDAFNDPAYHMFSKDSTKTSDAETYAILFKNASRESTIALLTTLQNNLKKFENKLVVFCHVQIPIPDRYYDSYSVIVGQSVKTVSPGEQLEISAGIGTFSLVAKPAILINGNTVLLNEQGIANLKIKAPTRLGSHLIPVIISFTDTEGKRVKREFSVEYSVREKCN